MRHSSERLLVGGLVLATYLAALGALVVGRLTDTTGAWWPAAGFGLLALLFTPRRRWPLICAALFLAYAAANLTAGRTLSASTLLGLSDLVETVVAATLVGRYIGRRMVDVNDVWRLFGIAILSAFCAALGIAGVYAVALDSSFWSTLLLVWPAHAAAIVLLAPFALLSRKSARLPGSSRTIELVAQVSLLVAATVVTFGAAQLTLGFAPLPVLVWAAARFDVWVVALEQIVFAAAVTLLTQLGLGPFSPLVDGDPLLSTQHAQLYLICQALVGLPLAKAMHQRDEALLKALASERTFRRNFTESRVPVAIVSERDGVLRFGECNEATVDLLGRPGTDLTGRRVTDILTNPDLERAAGTIARGQETAWSGAVGVMADARVRLDGTLSLIEQERDGALFSLHLVDVTEPQEIQERLEAERNYTRAVIDTASSMIVLTRLDGTVIAANPATTALTGFTEAELVGHPVWELLRAADQRETSAALFGEDAYSLPRSGDAQLRRKDGTPVAVVYSSATHRVSPDAPVTVVISATDVTAARHNAGMVNHLLRSARTIAFVVTDLDGRISLFNTGAEHMLGVSAATAAGKELTEFIARRDLDRYAVREPGQSVFDAIVDQAAGDLAPVTRDWTWLPADRAPIKVSMTTNPVTDAFGDLFGYLFVATDITDTLRNQEILVKALRRERDVVSRLRDLDRAKDEFVSTVSHELRTPMSSIIGCAEILADGMVGELAPDQQQMVDTIARNGDRLLALADDLLLLASFDHEPGPDQAVPVDLRDVVEESAGAVAPMLATRDLHVGYTLPGSPALVSGDPHHLERALTNLVTNGVKFTPDGGRVSVEVAIDEVAGLAVVTVADTGLGIPESDLDKVFGRFYRSADAQERAIQGSGLGLPIVKTIVESHQGQIEVSSRPGQGTTFTITLPLVRAKAPASRSATPVDR
jgi:PAS domain S-box-containing protein